MAKLVNDLEWQYFGSLDVPRPNKAPGVYIFVLPKKLRRIVYVGTSDVQNGMMARWRCHRDLFLIGGRTIWKPDPGKDVYPLMRDGKNRKATYIQRCKVGKMWLPGSRNANGSFLSHYGRQPFTKNWELFVRNEYLLTLEVYSCTLADPNEALVLESQLQRALGQRFRIGFYRNASQNWLGRQHVTDINKLRSIRFEFKTLPSTDGETLKVLANLYDHIRL